MPNSPPCNRYTALSYRPTRIVDFDYSQQNAYHQHHTQSANSVMIKDTSTCVNTSATAPLVCPTHLHAIGTQRCHIAPHELSTLTIHSKMPITNTTHSQLI